MTDTQRATHVVLVNELDQYALWPVHRGVPAGWRSAGVEGDEAACLAAVRRLWTDMRPRPLREAAPGGG